MLPAGQVVRVGNVEVRASQMIPAGHKIALREIAAGERVMRYGSRIGKASVAIHPGDHVHTKNLAFEEASREFELPTGDIPIPPVPANVPTFMWKTRARMDAPARATTSRWPPQATAWPRTPWR